LELAPTATIILNLTQDTEKILGGMKRQTRQKIRRSAREGIMTREGTEADLTVFYQLYLKTSQRQGFTPYPEAYFSRMWQVFSKQDLIHLIMAEHQGNPVSALLLISFGDTVIPKILGWSGEHNRRRPNDAVFWAAIQWAKTHGYQYYDMEGINREGAELIVAGQSLPKDLRTTPDLFKIGYGGSIMLMPQSYYFVPNPFLGWFYKHIFDINGRGKVIQGYFERFRRRFG
jgi:lipid II:glycine glycyltransferase (peptidoglycan interpeptide bridge formation enzyme)